MSPHTADRLADRESPAGLASTLMWQTQAVIHWLRDLDLGHEISAQDWVQLARYPDLLEAMAGKLRALVQLYEEGKGT